ncbi:phosphoenolpyruvate synthase [Anaerovirgula multivorans]|uniref:Phosphoenolpyruvate synthase n=1 Tax=Anaerovirgula multivorans TaxID=312168 RepID=A0A239J9W6_9FIRM|nr:phenylalanine--tRNA ligase beta subunit-related protein [Anaerovirgula multivorans]SNT02412.1 phosphoenolpyruvate synthase [Anaerovirgula multivorans]
MLYTVNTSVFELNPNIKFGILIGKNLKNSQTLETDKERLRNAESKLRDTIQIEQLKSWPNISFYRDVMTKAGINPNKYPTSVEAMLKRILKGGELPTINALVDLCNAVSLEHIITLGAHDLNDIHQDLAVRFSKGDEIFLPFGAKDYEKVDERELIFTSGNIVQTRKWIWRQSDLGKITSKSKDIFFQLVGFGDNEDSSFYKAMADIEGLVIERFEGTCEKYIVDSHNPSIIF